MFLEGLGAAQLLPGVLPVAHGHDVNFTCRGVETYGDEASHSSFTVCNLFFSPRNNERSLRQPIEPADHDGPNSD